MSRNYNNIFMFLLGIILTSDAVRHGRNLIWAMHPASGNGVSRIMAIEGDPEEWVPTANVTVRHISAPHTGWQFRGVAFHYDMEILFWTESSNKRIQGLTLNGSVSTRTVFTSTSNEVDGVVVDWISNNMYFADANYNWITLVALNSTDNFYKKIINTGLDKPHGIAIYPQKGYLFWSDWGLKPKIETSDLTGNNRRTLVSTDITHPRGLAVDQSMNKLYWVDSGKDTIERVDFNGNNRKTLAQVQGSNFFGIALYKRYLFVTEQQEGHLRIYDKHTGNKYINYQLGHRPYGIVMYDEELQPGDRQECEALSCEQICINNPPFGASCYCGDGYTLQGDQKTCVESEFFIQPAHIYAIGDAICQYPVNLADMSLVNVTLDKQCFMKNGKGFTALTYDASAKILYYTANMTNSIGTVQLKKGAYTDTVIRGLGDVRGMALDWTTSTLYWTDRQFKHIMVAKTDGRYQKAIIDSGLVEPLGIAVHPKRGTMYWTDPGRQVIEMSYMNGDFRAELQIFSGVRHPNHLCIDFHKDRLYWSDSELFQIGSYDLGDGHVTIAYTQQSAKFFGISIYQDYIIWTDTDKMNGIHVADLNTGTKKRGILHPQVGVSADLITYDQSNQPNFTGSCTDSPCDQLCLPNSPTTSFCACGTGFELDDGNINKCTSHLLSDNFLVVSDSHQRHMYQVGLDDQSVHAIPLSNMYRPIALDYDPIFEKLYWTDNMAKLIKGAHLDSQTEFTLQSLTNASVIDGIAVDYISRLLYYTNTGLDTITVISLARTRLSRTIVSEGLEQPRDIALHPLDGRMFWTDWGSQPKIEAANMDGSDRVTLVNLTENSWPNGIAVDYAGRKIYWVDAKYNKIEVVDINGLSRKTLIEEPISHYFGITVLGDYLYVTDWKRNYISRLLKTGGGSMEQVGPSSFSRVNGIAAYSRDSVLKGKNACFDNTCDHLCLPKWNFKYTCACSDGYVLLGDRCVSSELPNNTTTEPVSTPEPDVSSSLRERPVPDKGLHVGAIAAIASVGVIVAVIATIASIFLYRKYKNQFIHHDRLVEDNQVDSFYRITFPDNKDEPMVDSGIVNPGYKQMDR
ncbi:low-density lipoprotein receptor-related protein 4-like [Mizuhopecten yessoensis]|uniref:Low-density lipoprotein receptor-related protein 4 n=1 Tax=Mizuhopecten yessoensis TaxID=6573 RepID=A0A210PWK6_MIZYE|nr:low-density lipoprotein receptor-related protein 4-like [Mizuhopecten yessoensis]OWF40871.1 Low-density lipoprotein receptor-related protein 4 [Mizuhopecten yessoensis]